MAKAQKERDRQMRRSFLIIGLLTAVTFPANAADMSVLYGKWIEHFSNGAVFVYVFSPRILATFVRTKNGGESPASMPQRISYTDLGGSKIRVDYVPYGGWFIIKIKSRAAIWIIRLGEGVYSFTRLHE